MRTFNKIAAQGDVMFIRVDKLPENRELVEAKTEGASLIVTHSETGHHHVMEASKVNMFECKDDELQSFLVVHNDAELRHLRDFDTHESILFTKGVYNVRRQREHTPEGFRRVAD